MSDYATRFVVPHETIGEATGRVAAIALDPPRSLLWWLLFLPSLAAALLLVPAIAALLGVGIGIWGLAWPVVWGFDIVNYGFWMHLATGATVLATTLTLLRRAEAVAIGRLAEIVALAGAVCGGVFPIIHLGRPWLFYWLFPYPNTMVLWPQVRSPLFWDFASILAYVLGLIMVVWFGLLPDFATLRDTAESPHAARLNGILALGFRGSAAQWRRHAALQGLFTGLLLTIALSVQMTIAMDQAGGALPGFHSTLAPIVSVANGLAEGVAALLLLAIPLRAHGPLAVYFTRRHLQLLGGVLLLAGCAVGYGYLMDAWGAAHGGRAEWLNWRGRLHSRDYWGAVLLAVVAVQPLWRPGLRRPVVLWAVSLCVLVGMWFDHATSTIGSQSRPALPSSWGFFHATIWDWMLLTGTVGLFLTLVLAATRLLPQIAMAGLRRLVLAEPGVAAGR